MIEPISRATLQVTPILTWFGCRRLGQLLERIQERPEGGGRHGVCWVPSWQAQYCCLLGQLSGAGRSHCISRRVLATGRVSGRPCGRRPAWVSVSSTENEPDHEHLENTSERGRKGWPISLLPGDNCGERWGFYLFQTCTPSFPRPLPTLFFFSLFL